MTNRITDLIISKSILDSLSQVLLQQITGHILVVHPTGIEVTLRCCRRYECSEVWLLVIENDLVPVRYEVFAAP